MTQNMSTETWDRLEERYREIEELRQNEARRRLYESIARGNGMIEAEEASRRRWK